MTSVSACLNVAISSAVPIETRSQPSGPTSRISTPRSSSPCQTACRSAKRAEQREVRVAVGHLEPLLAQPGHGGVPLGAQVVDPAEQLGRVPQRRQRGRLGDGGEVVGQPHHADRVADLGRRGEVAQPGAGERERLAHGAGDDEVAVLAAAARARSACRCGGTRRTPRRRRRRRPARPAAASHRTPTASGGSAVPVGLFGRGQQHDARAAARGSARAPRSRSREKSLSRWPDHPLGHRVAGVLGIHRVRRREAQRAPARAAEGLEQLEHHLVGAVGRPHLLRGDAGRRVAGEVRRQRRPQLGELPVGVAVQGAGRLAPPRPRCRRRTAGEGP